MQSVTNVISGLAVPNSADRAHRQPRGTQRDGVRANRADIDHPSASGGGTERPVQPDSGQHGGIASTSNHKHRRYTDYPTKRPDIKTTTPKLNDPIEEKENKQEIKVQLPLKIFMSTLPPKFKIPKLKICKPHTDTKDNKANPTSYPYLNIEEKSSILLENGSQQPTPTQIDTIGQNNAQWECAVIVSSDLTNNPFSSPTISEIINVMGHESLTSMPPIPCLDSPPLNTPPKNAQKTAHGHPIKT